VSEARFIEDCKLMADVILEVMQERIPSELMRRGEKGFSKQGAK
jgi:hypothetical protein